MHVRLKDGEARRTAHQLRFQLTSYPLEFVAKVVLVPASTGKGHVVLAPLADTDYSISATIDAALLGGFYATPHDFINQDEPPRGIMYTEKYKCPKESFHVAVSAALAAELPTLPERSCARFFKRP